MRKIEGIKMNTITCFKGKIAKEKISQYKSLKESLEEVKLIKKGKIKPKAWRELLEELRDDEE